MARRGLCEKQDKPLVDRESLFETRDRETKCLLEHLIKLAKERTAIGLLASR
jgi:hypothetical protein